MERFDVRADAQLDDDNVMLTLSGSSWLLNVNASPAGLRACLAFPLPSTASAWM